MQDTMASYAEGKMWVRSLFNHHASLILTVPAPLVKSYGFVKGTRVRVRKTENGFEVLVGDGSDKKQPAGAESGPGREAVQEPAGEPAREPEDARKPTPAETRSAQRRRFPNMDGVVVE